MKLRRSISLSAAHVLAIVLTLVAVTGALACPLFVGGWGEMPLGTTIPPGSHVGNSTYYVFGDTSPTVHNAASQDMWRSVNGAGFGITPWATWAYSGAGPYGIHSWAVVHQFSNGNVDWYTVGWCTGGSSAGGTSFGPFYTP